MGKKTSPSELTFERIRSINLDLGVSTAAIDALIEAEEDDELFALCLAALADFVEEKTLAKTKH